MSQPRPVTGHSIPNEISRGRALVAVAAFGETLLHPIATIRRMRLRRGSPRWTSLSTMTPDEFADYARRTGIEARLTNVLAEVGGLREDQATTHTGVLSGQERP